MVRIILFKKRYFLIYSAWENKRTRYFQVLLNLVQQNLILSATSALVTQPSCSRRARRRGAKHQASAKRNLKSWSFMMREFGALRQALCCVNLVRFAKRKKNKLYPHISCSTISHELNGCHVRYQPEKEKFFMIKNFFFKLTVRCFYFEENRKSWKEAWKMKWKSRNWRERSSKTFSFTRSFYTKWRAKRR